MGGIVCDMSVVSAVVVALVDRCVVVSYRRDTDVVDDDAA